MLKARSGRVLVPGENELRFKCENIYIGIYSKSKILLSINYCFNRDLPLKDENLKRVKIKKDDDDE